MVVQIHPPVPITPGDRITGPTTGNRSFMNPVASAIRVARRKPVRRVVLARRCHAQEPPVMAALRDRNTDTC